ncbi:MAG: BatD family protein [Myxococcota bacterium]
MHRSHVLFAAVGMLLSTSPVRAAGVRAEVDRTSASAGESILLEVVVDGSRNAEPSLPPLDDFEVQPRGQSTEVRMINGSFSSQVSYRYLLHPKRLGRLRIGAATVEIDGRRYASDPIDVTVSTAPPSKAADADVYAAAEASTHTPYMGEQLVYRLQLVRRINFANATVAMPSFAAFVSQSLGEQREFETVRGGRRFRVTELRLALFPQQPGSLKIDAASFAGDVPIGGSVRQRGRRSAFDDPFGDFFGQVQSEHRVVRAPPIDVDVRPLPPTPPGFTGLVGTTAMTAELSKLALVAGESTTLTLTVDTVGNSAELVEPALVLPAGFKAYADKSATTYDTSGQVLRSRRTFVTALVPTRAGSAMLGPLSLTYFDPGTGAFASTEPVTLTVNVQAAAEGEALHAVGAVVAAPQKQDVTLLGDDLLPIYRRADALQPAQPPLWLRTSALALLVLPPLALLALVLIERRRGIDVSLTRRRSARRRARSGMRALGLMVDAKHIPTQASHIVRTYVGNKLGIAGAALTPGEVAQSLRQARIDASLIQRVEQLLSHLDAMQYAGSAPPSGAELARQIDTVITALEAQL